MKIPFYKYQGTGNDFVMIDNRENIFPPTDEKLIARLCDRRFGVGADGLILLQNKEGFDFEMVYFNSDGRPSSMCGNGGRCTSAFAKMLGIIETRCRFMAIDGEHEAQVKEDDWVELKMQDVQFNLSKWPTPWRGEDYFILDTGSPHYVIFVEDIDDINVVENGQAIRYSAPFHEQGINVNFVENTEDAIIVGTYERGVEDETLSCGTGVTACAIAHYLKHLDEGTAIVPVKTKGGDLVVRFQPNGVRGVKDIWLCGKASLVFSGEVEV